MQSESKQDWLPNARRIESPNFNERPVNQAIDLLVIHNISLPPGEFNGNAIERFFLNQLNFSEHPYYHHLKDVKVSSHLLIRRDGSVIQFVPFSKRAWHAGESQFNGRKNCNDFSIGIELEGDDYQPFTAQQYESLISATLWLQKAFPKITLDHIVGHSDIAPGRKTDPGEYFDWKKYKAAL